MKKTGIKWMWQCCIIKLVQRDLSTRHSAVYFSIFYFSFSLSHQQDSLEKNKMSVRSLSQPATNAPLWSSRLPEQVSYSIYSILLLLFNLCIALLTLSHYAFCSASISLFFHPVFLLLTSALLHLLMHSRCPVLFYPVFHNASEISRLFNQTWDFGR